MKQPHELALEFMGGLTSRQVNIEEITGLLSQCQPQRRSPSNDT